MENQLIDIVESKPLILIVDDIQKNLQLLANTLYDAGYEIAMAESGKEALEFIDEQLPELILLDVMMPEMTGFEVCEILKSSEKTKDIPIIFLTAKVEIDSVVEGFNKGAVDYVTKPFNTSELLARVGAHIELKRSKDIILSQNIHLEELNKKKSEFLGIAVHDLKNPLQSVLSFSELLVNKIKDDPKISEVFPEKYIEFLKYIKMSGNHMLKIVCDILNVETLESGKLKLERKETNLSETLKSLLSIYSITAQSKKIALNLSIPKSAIAFVDENRIKEAFENLISNALKYSNIDSNVWISLYFIKKDGVDKIIFKVKDEGQGLSDNDKTKLFGKFQKLTPRPTAGEPSTGLGLSIVKTIIELHDGRVWAESEVGIGSEFYIELNASNQEIDSEYLNDEHFQSFETIIEEMNASNCFDKIEKFSIDKYSDELKNKLRSLGITLKNDYLPTWNQIIMSNRLIEVKVFAKDLLEFSKNNNFLLLEEYSNQLSRVSNHYELSKISDTLKYFPILVSKLE